uniref:Uncharacterized protein n=1 Tax=Plectus sambesii TaxID=2011161 RepID=A0A914VMU9_9BILA
MCVLAAGECGAISEQSTGGCFYTPPGGVRLESARGRGRLVRRARVSAQERRGRLALQGMCLMLFAAIYDKLLNGKGSIATRERIVFVPASSSHTGPRPREPIDTTAAAICKQMVCGERPLGRSAMTTKRTESPAAAATGWFCPDRHASSHALAFTPLLPARCLCRLFSDGRDLRVDSLC